MNFSFFLRLKLPLKFVDSHNNSRETFIFNSQTGIWYAGPQLEFARYGQSSGRIQKSNGDNSTTIIVVGGGNETPMTSVEILDESSFEVISFSNTYRCQFH